MPSSVIVLNSQPGIQRDGTQYLSKSYIEGQWVRFYLGKPLKIAGFKLIDQGNGTIIRTLFNYDNPSNAGYINTYMGRADAVSYATFDLNGNIIGGEIDRTPTGVPIDANNLWDFDIFINSNAPDSPKIVAHVAPNANDSNNSNPTNPAGPEGGIYYGDTVGPGANNPLQLIPGAPHVSGGIVSIPPVVLAYGNGGLIQWCAEGDLTSWPGNTKTIATTKIIKVVLVRGSVQPQALAWTANSLISLSYGPSPSDPAVSDFSYTVIDNTITLMSANSIIGFASQYFWMGLQQFYLFNGVVQPLENTMNAKYLFDNIYLPSRAKVFCEVVYPSTGLAELWWHVPLSKPGDLTPSENNHVFIYQYKTKAWYDTPLNRAAGASSDIFPRPMMSDSKGLQIVTNTGIQTIYPIWMHEIGTDQVINLQNVLAIKSFFRTNILDLFESNPGANRNVRLRRVEPDFEMNGNMTVTIYNGFFPSDTIENGRLITSGPYSFDFNTPKIDAVNSQGRLVSLLFESDEIGGNYHMGKTLIDVDGGDIRPAGSGNSGTGS